MDRVMPASEPRRWLRIGSSRARTLRITVRLSRVTWSITGIVVSFASRSARNCSSWCIIQATIVSVFAITLLAAVLSGSLNLEGLHRRFYGMRVLPATPCQTPPKHYLTMMTTFKNMKPYLKEWIEFHRLVGFEHYYLYDNNSTDHPREVLDEYIKQGIVTLTDFPSQFRIAYDGTRENFSQKAAILHALAIHRCETRWMGLLDMDEFVFSPSDTPISKLLKNFEAYGGVSLAWLRFGTSNHVLPPDKVTIEGYKYRMRVPSPNWKNIVQPAHVAGIQDVHEIIYHSGYYSVDERHRPVARHTNRNAERSFSILRLHHYFTRSSLDWWLRVYDRGSVSGTYRKFKVDDLKYYGQANEVFDDSALFMAERLKEAMHWNGSQWQDMFLSDDKVRRVVAVVEQQAKRKSRV